MSDKAIENGEGVQEEDSHKATDSSPGTEDRIGFLEKEYRQLSFLFHEFMSQRSKKKDGEPVSDPYLTTPKPEIQYVSLSEWRALQVDPNQREEYPLLTVLPKRPNDNGLDSQTRASPLDLDDGTTETWAEHRKASRLDDKGYIAILNGNTELMEVLGETIKSSSLPGYYIWSWPFKHLVYHGEKVRARLLEEESKTKDLETLQASQGPQLLEESSNEQPDVPHNEAGPIDQTTAEDTETNKQSDTADNSTKSVISLGDQLRCIVQFMDNTMADIFATQRSITDGTSKTIAFDYLWLLYKPGDILFSGTEPKRAYMVLRVTGGRALYRTPLNNTGELPVGEETERHPYLPADERVEREAYLAKHPRTSPFVIDCFYIDYDGTNFGPLPKTISISEYHGEVRITSLEAFPIRFADSPKTATKTLLKRGKRFVKLARVDHKRYAGRTVGEPVILENQAEVHGEIIIDFALALKNFREVYRYNSYRHKDWDIKFNSGVIANPTIADVREKSGFYDVIPSSSLNWKPTYFMEEATFDLELRHDFTDKTTMLKERTYDEQLPEEALMLLPPRVYGFSLLDRAWYAFDIDKVEDIKMDQDQGFRNLVLPQAHKDIMQALVQNHTKSSVASTAPREDEFSIDVVRGKGKGLIILLHGIPGTGKTSTAECVAAQTRRPLFPITCGDIGINARDVEERLTEYFDMAHKWGCVLLLDEADVFLAKRERGGDLQRNGIVSVFLRVLEYYSGILILTTNRIGEFDEAFSSRVHVKLYYPKLDRNSTLEIWKMNLERIVNSNLNIDIQEKDIKKFAKRLWSESTEKQTQRWNGRQIRNAFQTAIALARWDHQQAGSNGGQRPCLTVKHFEIVATTSAHFDKYISSMYGFEEGADAWEAMAARDQVRKNETFRKPQPVARRGNRMAIPKIEEPEEDNDSDTDSDEGEEKVKELQAKLDRLKMKKVPPTKRPQDSHAGQSQKSEPSTKAGDEVTSSESDDED